MNKIGLFYLECLSLNTGLEPSEKQLASQNLLVLLGIGCKCLDQECPSACLCVVEFINQFLILLKHQELIAAHTEILQYLLTIVVKRIQYPDWYSFENESNNSLEENVVAFRNELTTIFGNIVANPSIQSNIIEYIANLVATLKNSYKSLTAQNKEVVLYLFYRLGEQLKGNCIAETN